MVFFNYSTMQMAAKIVYYGPGLCGKTTNLQHIYGRTSDESRGEMVSLETETDRTLFFDLLPIDVGSIAGFNTRIQLYTVPGQVFYNTTRKLVLKGVDGVVFVADSQKPMLQANRDSFKNLEENLQEMGLTVEEIPLVLQYNKRDLPDICTVDELNAALNQGNRYQWFESVAIDGTGVFETLKGISKLTLMSLRQRLTRDDTPKPAASKAAVSKPATPRSAPPQSAPSQPEPAQPEPAQPTSPRAPAPAAGTTPAAEAAAAQKTPAAKRKDRDVMGELEKLELEHTRSGARRRPGGGATPVSPVAPTAPEATNGRREVSRNVELTLSPEDLRRVRRFSVSLQMEDGEQQVVESIRGLQVDVDQATDISKLLLRLQVALNARK